MSKGVVMIVAGVWLILQTAKGGLVKRLGLD